ncbi:alpha/beta hydrolase [Phenylobacterium sp.]|uniref:alpha/beta hydrolase n=1 Tax=Phenylobacterium sp. TaxID=1871053 RepID=UPI0035B3DC49
MVRAPLIAALMLSLAACGPRDAREPFAESRLPPALSSRFFPPEGWAWGFVGVGTSPVQRYGVASTPRVPRAVVVIVPGYGETAETWFETASDLIEEGCTVWVLDRAGQGGSGRYATPRDLGFTPSFDPDVAALRELLRVVVKPPPGTRVVVIGHADGAVVALAAARANGLRADALIVSSAKLAAPLPAAGFLAAFRRPDARPLGWKPWSKDLADDRRAGRTHDAFRGEVTKAWMTANPDLRLAGPSLGWNKAYETASRSLESSPGQITAPVVMIAPDSRAAALCARIRTCRVVPLAGAGESPHLEADRWRKPWLSSVIGVLKDEAARSNGLHELSEKTKD